MPEKEMKLVIVTGMSGAGKTVAMQSFEDMGYFCIDNIPPVLIPKFSEICRQSAGTKVSRVALVVDIRSREFFDDLNSALDDLTAMSVPYEIVFMEASDDTLIRRYKETRRSHPLAPSGRISTGLSQERALLADVRSKADHIIDTTNMKTSALKSFMRRTFSHVKEQTDGMAITVVSFGFNLLFRTDIFEMFGRQIMSHLISVDNPWCIIDMTTISQRNLNLIQSSTRKTGSSDNILVTSDFLNNGID